MRNVKAFLTVALLVTMVMLSVSALFTPVEAKKEAVYNAGFKIYGADGKVIGCDCPSINGSCICVTRSLN